jgi:Tectonin domain
MSCKNAYWSVLLVLICCAGLVIPASAQQFLQVKGTLTSVSAGRNEIFGVDSKAAVWRYHPTTKSFGKIAKASLASVVVGGGTASQLDEVWGLAPNNNDVYRFNYTTKAFVNQGESLDQIVVGVGYQDNCHPYEVWGVNSAGNVQRYNYCTNFFDSGFNVLLTQVVTGGGDVWGLSSSGQIFHYSFQSQSFAQVSGTLTQISVGVNDVWGVNGSSNVFRYDPATQKFNSVGGNTAQVAAGGDGVWVVSTSNDILRFDSSSATFVQITGILQSVAVGSGAGVFGINSAHQVFTFVRP